MCVCVSQTPLSLFASDSLIPRVSCWTSLPRKRHRHSASQQVGAHVMLYTVPTTRQGLGFFELQWVSHGFPIGFLWVSYEFPVGFPWANAVGFLWIYHGFLWAG